jgi:asparagine synthetase B (glutamine-hydrolysing)
VSWLDEPAFPAERAPIARWATSITLPDEGRVEADGPTASFEIVHGEELRIGRVGDVTIATAGIQPEACIADLRRILGAARPELVSSQGLRGPDQLGDGSGGGDADRGAPYCWVALLEHARVAVACRDPLGRMPLFWHREGDRLILTPDSERILELVGPRSPNPGALIGQLSSLWGPPEETYLDGVRRVPPGRVLIADPYGQRLIRHWDPIGEMPAGSQPLDRERFRDLVERAVTREAAGARVGIYLSGGLDSVGVAALAKSCADSDGSRPPYALSIDFSGSEFDESRTQAAVATALGLEQTLRPHGELCGGDPLVAVLELASTMPAPPQNFFLPGFIALGRHGAALGCARILTGTGGDEWLGVTPALAADLIARRDWRGLLDLYRTVYRSNPVRRTQAARAVVWRFGVRALLGTQLARARKGPVRRLSRAVSWRHRRAVPGWIAPGAAGAAELDRRFSAAAELRPASAGAHYATETRNGFDHPVATTEAEEHVEEGRRVGVPLRHPFLDPELVRLLCAARVEDLNDGRRSKAPLRGLVSQQLPGLGFESQRKPIAAGYVSGLVGDSGPGAYARMGGPRALAELGVVDRTGTDRLVDSVRAGSDRVAPYRLWEVLCLEAWARSRV